MAVYASLIKSDSSHVARNDLAAFFFFFFKHASRTDLFGWVNAVHTGGQWCIAVPRARPLYWPPGTLLNHFHDWLTNRCSCSKKSDSRLANPSQTPQAAGEDGGEGGQGVRAEEALHW